MAYTVEPSRMQRWGAARDAGTSSNLSGGSHLADKARDGPGFGVGRTPPGVFRKPVGYLQGGAVSAGAGSNFLTLRVLPP